MEIENNEIRLAKVLKGILEKRNTKKENEIKQLKNVNKLIEVIKNKV